MVEKNKSEHHSLVPGDGTQNQVKPSADANWFGKSKEPQEEFAQQSSHDELRTDEHKTGPKSEGKPTLGGDGR